MPSPPARASPKPSHFFRLDDPCAPPRQVEESCKPQCVKTLLAYQARPQGPKLTVSWLGGLSCPRDTR